VLSRSTLDFKHLAGPADASTAHLRMHALRYYHRYMLAPLDLIQLP
jgi:hypothetical protein